MKNLIRRWLQGLIYLGIILGFLGILNYSLIGFFVRHQNSFELEDVPTKKVALILGTSQYLRNGSTNLYFKFRIEAVQDLWEAGKIKYVLVSGDNSTKSYDEPTAIRKALIKKGIPADRIVLDYAGFRTLDSMVRAKKVFGQEDFIVVSQQFHVERALVLARFNDIKAYGYNAVDVTEYAGFRTKLREYFARMKLWVDIVFGVDPKFLGEPVVIP